MGFFKAFFKMAAYSSNEIVDIILMLDEAGRNYCRAESCIVIDIRLDDIQMQCR